MKCLLTEHHCTVEAAHLAGSENGEADQLSRLVTTKGDSTVKIAILHQAWARLGVSPVIDMFAADHNHRLPKF